MTAQTAHPCLDEALSSSDEIRHKNDSPLETDAAVNVTNPFFKKIVPFPASFSLSLSFSIQLIVNLDFADDWIRTSVL